MKKQTIYKLAALVLSLVMCMGLFPTAALAAPEDGYEVIGGTLHINGSVSLADVSETYINVLVNAGGTITDGTCAVPVLNHGTIAGGVFSNSVDNTSSVTGGTFNGEFFNQSGGSVSGAALCGVISNLGTISGASFGANASVSENSGSIAVSMSVNGTTQTFQYGANVLSSLGAGDWCIQTNGGALVPVGAGDTFSLSTRSYVSTPTYEISITGGKAYIDTSAPAVTSAKANELVTIVADDAPLNKDFFRWVVTAGGAALTNTGETTTTFRMPAANVAIAAAYSDEEIVPNAISLAYQVTVTGSSVPARTFEYQITTGLTDDVIVSGSSVATNGARSYDASLTIAATPSQLDYLKENGFTIRQKAATRAGWTFSSQTYSIAWDENDESWSAKEGAVKFQNSYSKPGTRNQIADISATGIQVPVVGQSVNWSSTPTLPSGVHYSLYQVGIVRKTVRYGWIEHDTAVTDIEQLYSGANASRWIYSDESKPLTFKEGKYYTCAIFVQANNSYSFATTANITGSINGMDAIVSDRNYNSSRKYNMSVYYTFTPQPAKTESTTAQYMFTIQGNGAPYETFEIKLTGVDSALTVTGTTVHTRGTGSYTGNITFTGSPEKIAALKANGFTAEQIPATLEGWTLSEANYRAEYNSRDDVWRFPVIGEAPGSAPSISLWFVNEYNTPEPETITIPFTKFVTGADVPREDRKFTFEIAADYLKTDAGQGVTITGNTVTTNGADTYNGEITISGTPQQIEYLMRNGVTISETQDTIACWTFSTSRYIVFPATDGGWAIYELSETGARTQRDQVAFTNRYTAPTYKITVNEGTSYVGRNPAAQAKEGENVDIIANSAPIGQEFDRWVTDSANVTFEDATSSMTRFTMPAEAVSVTATFRDVKITPVEPIETILIPFEKIIEQGGTVAPGQQTFTYELFGFESANITEDQLKISGTTITTDGTGTFQGEFKLEVYDRNVLGLLTDGGFYIREKRGTEENWTYSDEIYHVVYEPLFTMARMRTASFSFWKFYKTKKLTDGTFLDETPAVPKLKFTSLYTKTDTPPAPGVPGTGDNFQTLLWITLVLFAATELVGTFAFDRRRRSVR